MASQFQSFDSVNNPAAAKPRLAALREELRRQGLDAFAVPRADEHQGEYVPENAQRLAWLTGFTGSAGAAIAGLEKAAIFVDGRYTIQVREQVDPALFEPMELAGWAQEQWIATNLPKGGALGFDPWLHTPDSVAQLEKAVANAGGKLVPTQRNPLDAVWANRPAAPRAQVKPHALVFAGETAEDKLKRVRAALQQARCSALVISDPHALAWLFNIRGGDVGHTPLPLGYALIPMEGKAQIFLDPAKLNDEVRGLLKPLADLGGPQDLELAVVKQAKDGARIRLDSATAGFALKRLVEQAGGIADIGPDPIALMKAVKNPVEREGTRAAHRRDGAAVTRFLAWFNREAASGKLTEIAAAEALEDFRRETNALADLSFPTISAAGPNAAMPHYRVTRQSDRRIEHGIYLVDSGAQYNDGTTDITRTLAVGTPSAEMRDRNTRVLKGHIAIARAVFPKGTSGAQIDAFARQYLWQAGLDFDHGTGHGVGSYLSVHEGPQRISKLGTTPLQAGMILSNEPGYYKEGAYGIRIENLVLVEEREIPGGDRQMLGFETLTLAPIDLALIERNLLSQEEVAWLNAYHARVRETLGGQVDAETAGWLEQATRAI
ncbi:aminopeptidase P family protein [Ferrovibrio sp.]|uniref:aminopeptidase P family protein n=1 Tax=Ferrovibrio sp. TaxID=1917215 RepID=UPI0025BBE9FF|nr:aminopeptidase P family protein [Ferrovibrio sp.]MBX3454060.1 aminopeptidase P family protein [Ferrovibrio sp.]